MATCRICACELGNGGIVQADGTVLCVACDGKMQSAAVASAMNAPGSPMPPDAAAGAPAAAESVPLITLTGKFYGTKGIVALNCLAFVAMFLTMGPDALFPSAEQLHNFGGNFGPSTRLDGQFWRIITCCFVHAGIIHLAMNMYVFYSLGRLAEQFFGLRRFLIVYMAAGIAGALASMWWNPTVVSVGASGAILGIGGGMIALLHVNSAEFDPGVAPLLSRRLWANMGLCIVAGFTLPNTDNACHVGGFATGFLMGFAFAPVRAQRNLPLREIAGCVMFVAAAALAYAASEGRIKGSAPVVAESKGKAYNEYVQRVMPLLEQEDQLIKDIAKELKSSADDQKTLRLDPARAAEVRSALEALRKAEPSDVDILPLHRSLVARMEAMLEVAEAAVTGMDEAALIQKFLAVGRRFDEFIQKLDEFGKRFGLEFDKGK